MSGPNPAMGANLAQWAAQRGPKNPNAPQPNISNMPGITQGPASLGMGGQPGGMQRLQGPPPQGAPGQGPGGGKPQAMKQQMATLPGGPR
jgi:hypothetical protein